MTLNEWMKKNKISDGEMAEILGLNRVSINRLRRGENPPSWPTMANLAEVTAGKVMPNDFLETYKETL